MEKPIHWVFGGLTSCIYQELNFWKIRLLLDRLLQLGSSSSLLTFEARCSCHMTYVTSQAGIFTHVLSCCFQKVNTCSSWLWHSFCEDTMWAQRSLQMFRFSADLTTMSGTESAFQGAIIIAILLCKPLESEQRNISRRVSVSGLC